VSANLTVTPVADGVWSADANDHRTIFAAAGEKVVAVNGFGTPELSAEYSEAIRATVPAATIAGVIASIDHLDHSARASELAGGGELIAHELCARILETRGQRPTQRLSEDAELELGGLRLSLLYRGPSQGSGNLAVHLPQQRVLFLVGPRADARYGLFPDMHFKHLTRVWRELAELDVDVVVPGRGQPMDVAGLRRAADYVDALAEASQRAFADGIPIWVIEAMEPYVREKLLGRFGDLGGFDRHVGIGSIRVVHYYLMGGWGLEDTARPELLLVDEPSR
jgi:glyoxylase-like metal-dependent hydrolase (beta-lactamase superfamily II)